MILIKQHTRLRFLSGLIVICGFIENTTADIQFEFFKTYQEPDYSVFYKAAELSKSLANRNHTLIGSVFDSLMTEDKLKDEIEVLYDDRVKYIERIDDYKDSLKDRLQSINEYTANNEIAINATFDHTLGNDENGDDQLNAQIIRNRLSASMKMIQLLLPLAVTQHPQRAEFDSKVIELAVENKTQLLQRVQEHLKNKSHAIREVLDDVSLSNNLKDRSQIITLEQAYNSLKNRAAEILETIQIPTAGMMESFSTEWKNFATILNDDQPDGVQGNWYQMQNLTKCFEFGIAAYKECRQNQTKLAEFAVHVDKFRDELKKWNEYEQNIYGIILPALEKIEMLSGNESVTNLNSLVLTTLPELDNVLVEMQQNQLYSSDLTCAIENTKQSIRMVISLNNHQQVVTDKEALVRALQEIQKLGAGPLFRMMTMDGIITANLMMEMCKTTREILKMRIIPFDQDYLELCNMPAIPNPELASEHVKHYLLDNIERLKYKLLYDQAVGRPQHVVLMTSNNARDPFYEWKSKDFKNEISRLLNGEEVIFNADIVTAAKYRRNRNAVRFFKLVLDFHLANASRQNEFYKVINGTGVKMTRIGDNYFRCDKRIYYLPTDINHVLTYHIEVLKDYYNEDEFDTILSNDLSRIIMERDAFLSPYNIWKIQLDPTGQSQTKLREFINDEIDLRLRGKFRYVQNRKIGNSQCHSDDLNKNYHFERLLED